MNPSPGHIAGCDAADDDSPGWQLVLRWPGLSGESKLAWRYLWIESHAAGQLVVVTSGSVGAYQGTSDDAGRRGIENLAAEGLVFIRDRDRRLGRWLIEVQDPSELSRMRRLDPDPQQKLSFDPEARSTSEGVTTPSVPDRAALGAALGLVGAGAVPRRPTYTSEREKIGTSTSTSELLTKGKSSEVKRSSQREVADRGTASVSATRIGDTMESILRNLPSAKDQQQQVEELAQHIFARVACHKLSMSPCLKAARAIIDGSWPARELDQILHSLDRLRAENRLKLPPSAYFNGAVKTSFRRLAIEWGKPAIS